MRYCLINKVENEKKSSQLKDLNGFEIVSYYFNLVSVLRQFLLSLLEKSIMIFLDCLGQFFISSLNFILNIYSKPSIRSGVKALIS